MFSIRQRRMRFTPCLRRLSQMKDRLEKLTLILDEQEDILNQLLVIYGLRVNENLKKYFTILQSELTQQRTPRLNLILEYFHIMDLSNYDYTLHLIQEEVTRDKDLSAKLEILRGINNTDEVRSFIDEVIIDVKQKVKLVRDKINFNV